MWMGMGAAGAGMGGRISRPKPKEMLGFRPSTVYAPQLGGPC